MNMEIILQHLGLTTLLQRFVTEGVEPDTVLSMTDGELIGLGVTRIGDRVRIRDLCRETVKDGHAGNVLSMPRSEGADNFARDIRTERNMLFRPQLGPSRVRPRDRQGQSKRKRNSHTWTGHFLCLSDRCASKIPNAAEKQILHKAGLGYKKIQFNAESSAKEMIEKLTSNEKPHDGNGEYVGFPQLRECGGFEMLHCSGGGIRTLQIIQCPWNVADLKANIGPQSKIYLRPIQKNFSTKPIVPENDTSMLIKETCQGCLKEFDVRELRLWSCVPYSSSESETESPPAQRHMSATDVTVEPVAETESLPAERHANDTDVTVEHVAETESLPAERHASDTVEPVEESFLLPSDIEETNRATPIVKTVDDIVEDVVQYCNVHNFSNNPIEVLQYFQKVMVTGRKLDVENEAEVLEGETNFIMVNRDDIISTAFSEIRDISDLRITLEVQFYDETAADYGGPRKEFFVLVLREIKTKYFDGGLKDHLSGDYYCIGIIMGLSILQNGKLPQFMESGILDEFINSNDPSECVLNLRNGLSKLGIYQLCCKLPTFVHLLRPSQSAALTVKKVKELLRPEYAGEEGSNTRMYEKSIYAVFLDYIREVGSGRRGQISLSRVLQFITGTDEEPPLGFALHPKILFPQAESSFIPLANTCVNCLHLPRPSPTYELLPKVKLFELYDHAFSQNFFGNV